jgi:hypothetical protein
MPMRGVEDDGVESRDTSWPIIVARAGCLVRRCWWKCVAVWMAPRVMPLGSRWADRGSIVAAKPCLDGFQSVDASIVYYAKHVTLRSPTSL